MEDLEKFLRQSLADRKLSGNERTALAEWMTSNVKTPQDRGLARHTVFEVARSVIGSMEALSLLDWLEEAMKAVEPLQKTGAIVSTPDAAFFSPGDACRARIASHLNNIRRSADLCVFTITDDRITRAILDAHRRGVRLRVLTDNDKAADLGSDIEEIANAGIAVRVDRTAYHMHHKFAIFDDAVLLNGSYNWTRGAAEYNFENLVETRDGNLLAAFREEFETLWKKLA